MRQRARRAADEETAGLTARAAGEAQKRKEELETLKADLESIQRQCTLIHTGIYQAYIAYPIEVALTSRGAAQA